MLRQAGIDIAAPVGAGVVGIGTVMVPYVVLEIA